jgi:hypothetical protein
VGFKVQFNFKIAMYSQLESVFNLTVFVFNFFCKHLVIVSLPIFLFDHWIFFIYHITDRPKLQHAGNTGLVREISERLPLHDVYYPSPPPGQLCR